MRWALHWRDMQVSEVVEYYTNGTAQVVVLSLDGPRLRWVCTCNLIIKPY